jgi:hypothetical protein
LDCTSFERKPYMLITDKYYIVMDIHGGVCWAMMIGWKSAIAFSCDVCNRRRSKLIRLNAPLIEGIAG